VYTKSAVAMAIAQEVLRVTPPVKLLTRRVTEDIVLGDIAVPAGTDVGMAPRKVRISSCPFGLFSSQFCRRFLPAEDPTSHVALE
jgi:hypothetical protein